MNCSSVYTEYIQSQAHVNRSFWQLKTRDIAGRVLVGELSLLNGLPKIWIAEEEEWDGSLANGSGSAGDSRRENRMPTA